MNEWEIIGRFVDLDNRLRTLEGRPTVQEKPQPVATLCDAAEALMLFVDQHCNYHDIDPLLADLRHALSAERKRAARISKIVSESKANGHSSTITPENDICHICQWLAALDAFDKGAENG